MLTTLRAFTRILTKYFDTQLIAGGIKATQLIVLQAIGSGDSKTLEQLAYELSMDRTTLSRNGTLLEKEEYIFAEKNSDKRKRVFTLTKKGRETVNESELYFKKAEQQIKNLLGDAFYSGLNISLCDALATLKSELNNH